MTDMYEEADLDPIAALTLVTSARERYAKAEEAVAVAQHEYAEAMEQLNRSQDAFDNLVRYLRENAPVNSNWWHRHMGGKRLRG